MQDQKQKTEYQKQLELHLQQQQGIRQQMQAQSALVSQTRPISLMLDQFENNQGFYIKVQKLCQTYSTYRKTRRDGSCFYRALTFSIFQAIYVRKDKQLKQKIVKKLKDAKPFLLKAGFEGLVFEDMLQMLLQKIDDPKITTIEEVVSVFCDAETSNYIILFMRYLTSGQLKNNAILYETFIDNGAPIEYFCQTEVEPLEKQADQIQIMALLNYLEVAIKILYLDANVNCKQATCMVLPESAKPEQIKATLLYRPGHYDILYQ